MQKKRNEQFKISLHGADLTFKISRSEQRKSRWGIELVEETVVHSAPKVRVKNLFTGFPRVIAGIVADYAYRRPRPLPWIPKGIWKYNSAITNPMAYRAGLVPPQSKDSMFYNLSAFVENPRDPETPRGIGILTKSSLRSGHLYQFPEMGDWVMSLPKFQTKSKNPINFINLSRCPNLKAVEYCINQIDTVFETEFINWCFSMNPCAWPWLKRNPKYIMWPYVCANPAAVDYIFEHTPTTGFCTGDYEYLCENPHPRVIKFLESLVSQNVYDVNDLAGNTGIFEMYTSKEAIDALTEGDILID